MKCFLLCLLENTEETKTTWLIIPSIFSEKVELFLIACFTINDPQPYQCLPWILKVKDLLYYKPYRRGITTKKWGIPWFAFWCVQPSIDKQTWMAGMSASDLDCILKDDFYFSLTLSLWMQRTPWQRTFTFKNIYLGLKLILQPSSDRKKIF